MKLSFSILVISAVVISCQKERDFRVDTIYPTNITQDGITCGGFINNPEGRLDIQSCGISYSLDPNDLIPEDLFAESDAPVQQGAFRCELSNLIPDTVYYLLAYAKTDEQTYYSFHNKFEIRTQYNLGHSGPAGGIIIGLSDDKLHGIEISPEDLPAAAWGCKGTSIPAAENLPTGFGDDNTLAIIAACDTINAASTCANYSLNGYDDWYLPSAYELHYAFQNYFIKEDMWPFYSYFSSSQYDANNAWLVSLHDGKFTYTSKSSVYPKIRAIRYF